MLLRVLLLLSLSGMVTAPAMAEVAPGPLPNEATLRQWIIAFEQQPRGPFERILWYCNDGSILPPKSYACVEHGGGFQHGEWNQRALSLREHGFLIANLFTAMQPERFIGPAAKLDEWKQILLEQYLIGVDDGWIYRRARYYRGAIQIEAEQDRATHQILKMLADPHWLTPDRFLLLRETARLLPLAIAPQLGANIRQLASEIEALDPTFNKLKVKIHNRPDEGDARRVRAFAKARSDEEIVEKLAELATSLDALYATHTVIEQLQRLAKESRNIRFRNEIAITVDALQDADDPAARVAVAASQAARFRNILEAPNRYTVYNRLRFLRASLMLEQLTFGEGNRLLESIESGSGDLQQVPDRATRLEWLKQLSLALYAAGLFSDRQWLAMQGEMEALLHSQQLSLASYASGLRYLARSAQWSQRRLEYHFAATIKQWQKLTPLVQHFIPDRLRGSPLLPFTRILDTLITDADRAGGISHTLFGAGVTTGVRALNPGISRGRLLLSPKQQGAELARDGIYLMPFTRRELTPIAGIITRGEGSSVSHIQLLARNLGIPNLYVGDQSYKRLLTHVGEQIVMAVTPSGVVRIEADHGQFDDLFKESAANDSADGHILSGLAQHLQKLNLKERMLIPLHSIRARDSGRIVGPKAANLGELSHYYPGKVNPGIVIPFGLFRKHLEQPFKPGGESVFEWMKQHYAALATIASDEQRSAARKSFLARLRAWILDSDPGAQFRAQLAAAMREQFGPDGSYGLFVRSDTNLEDLPEFNGAGLNLTVANVVGFEQVLRAILKVWASPFSDRAFAWRQAYMPHPESLYPAVLLMKSVPADKSGVLVTADIDSGDRSTLSIAVNEGIGGAVEGQFAEELRVDRASGGVKLLAQASDPMRRTLNPKGGLIRSAVSGAPAILTQDEIDQLRELVDDVEQRFPLPQRDGRPVVADIEFGFVNGALELFQIRPFVESGRARRSLLLAEMDRQFKPRGEIIIRLDQPPRLVAEQ